jgi:purine-cytosine permease-like protein
MHFVIFVLLFGLAGKNFTYVPMATGDTERLGCLSYGALIFSWGITWAPMTADYSSYLSEKTSKKSVFWWTLAGNYFGSTLAFILGIALTSLIANEDPAYNFGPTYDAGGFGALTGAVFGGHGSGLRNFGRFIQTLLGLGIIAANVPNMYSFALDIQAVSSFTQKVPRALVTIFGALCALAISLGLRNNFIDALQNFMDLFGYWFVIILLSNSCNLPWLTIFV